VVSGGGGVFKSMETCVLVGIDRPLT
jgi:hypothetical protein